MTIRRLIPEGAAFAEVFSAVSRGLKLIPPLNDRIVGNNNGPHCWQVLRTHADTVKSWVEFEGDPEASRFDPPRNYRWAGLVAAETAEMDDLRAKYPGALGAMALRFGDVMVVGAFAPGVNFGRVADPSFNGGASYDVGAITIGRHSVRATSGVSLPAAGTPRFVPVESAQRYSRMHIADVSPGIPIA
jgi:hypothetical protein